MKFLWNHWFWITLGLIGEGHCESRPLKVQELGTKDESSAETKISLPLGARGGKVLIIPSNQSFLNRSGDQSIPFDFRSRPSVSVSKSVSKVSVKVGKISEEPRVQSLARFPTLFVDRGNLGKQIPQPRRIDPQYVGYNLVYREPLVLVKPTKPPGLLHTIISKLRSLAKATTSKIRLSSLLAGDSPFSSPEPETAAPPTAETTAVPVSIHTTTESAVEDEPVNSLNHISIESIDRLAQNPHGAVRKNSPGSANVFVRIDDLKVTADEQLPAVPPSQPTSVPIEDDSFNVIDNEIKMDVQSKEVEEVIKKVDEVQQDNNLSVEKDSRPRSLKARGRSLPIHVLQDLEIVRKPVSDRFDQTLVRIKEVKSQDWERGWRGIDRNQSPESAEGNQSAEEGGEEEWVEEESIETDFENGRVEVEDSVRMVSMEELEPASQGDFSQDFNIQNPQKLGTDDILIEAEKVDPANISAIIGVVVGIIIFIIISIVLVLLGLQRGEMKKAGPAEDVISQSSYMTYSTTVSEHSVNYGPNWDKDMVEDLCSLDNDSFLNSLEAVATTDYWGEHKY